MKIINPIISILILITLFSTIFFVSALKPVSSLAFLFLTLWLLSPYILIIISIILLNLNNKATLHWYAVTFLVTAGSIFLLTDIIFWHPDPQGAIGVLLLPIIQSIAFAALLPISKWILRKYLK